MEPLRTRSPGESVDTELGSILDALGPAGRFADPDSPLDGRLMAARGALPLPPPQLATVLYALTLDPEPEVKQRASESLQGLPERILDTALDAELHPAVLAFFAEHLRGDSTRMEKLALNSGTSDSTLCFLAGLPYLRVIEIVSNNQVRLLRCPGLFEALGENPLTSQSIIDRILEFLGLKREPASGAEPDPQAGAQSAGVEAAAADPSWNDPSQLPEELVTEEVEGNEEQEEERSRNLAGLLRR